MGTPTVVGEEERRAPVSFGPKAIWALIAIFAVVVILFAAWTFLLWSIAQHVYSTKSDLSWFGITFYHGYTFLVGGVLALLVVNPKVGKSDLAGLVSTLSRRATSPYGEEYQRPLTELRPGAWVWGLWQFVKWALVFGYFVINDSFPTLGPVMNSVAMLTQGLGSWAQVPRLLALPVFPASGTEMISLMPTMEVQYYLVYYVVSAFLTVFAIRMVLRLLKNLTTRGTYVWLRNVLAIAAAIGAVVVLGGPYWYMNAMTPYLYGVSLVLLGCIVFGYLYFGKRRDSLFPTGGVYRLAAVVLIVLLIVQVGAVAFLYFNWSNNYVPYQFDPGTQKEITVTRWAGGIQNITYGNVTSLPTSNSSTILDVVRQWDQTAANVTNTKAIGAYNWMALGSSEIVFLNGTEYWVSPTTVKYPATDWISQHLLYTHAAKILTINTYSGAEVNVTSAFGVPTAPQIYYGEGSAFYNDVYVHVPGYDEIGGTYSGAADYTLTGWQKAMWMTFAEGQVGFAFNSETMQMLWNRNVFARVQSVLIPGLEEDPAAYLVTDGTNIYYCVQVYIEYPLQSGFADSPYLRFFGVALVNVANGEMQFYNVSNLVGTNPSDFLTQFYSNYYSAWQSPPSWLVPQLRYPEQLLGTQSNPGQLDVDFQFHVNNPYVWRSGSQFYQRPTTTTNGTTTVNGVQYIPWAVGNKTYFAATQLVHYVNAPSQNLAGMYIAYGGDRLGQIYLYQNNSTSTVIIGPSAAENALQTNQQVRTQLTLLPTGRWGSYLLYSVGGTLTYFVAYYLNPGSSGVVTRLAFMTAVSPLSDQVGEGGNATAAYQNLLAVEAGSAPSSSGITVPGLTTTTTTSTTSTTTTSTTSIATGTTQQLLAGISSLASSSNLNVVSATTVSPNVFINTATVSLAKVGVSGALSQVSALIQQYGPGSAGNSLYVWNDSSGLNVGIFQLKGGVTDLYYVTIGP